MSDDISVIKVYDDEMEASMAQQVLENAGIKVTLLKDDGGGLMPSLQMTEGVSLIVNKDDASVRLTLCGILKARNQNEEFRKLRLGVVFW